MKKKYSRWINEKSLLNTLNRALTDSKLLPEKDRERYVLDRMKVYLANQPRQPRLVGVTVAAQILEVPKPRIMRFRNQGRMPEPITVEGPSADIYLEENIKDMKANDVDLKRLKRQEQLQARLDKSAEKQ